MTRHELTLPVKTSTRSVYEHGKYESDHIFLVAGASRSGGPGGWGLCGWSEEGQGRLTHGGPMVAGPVASLFGLCGVIDTHGGTGREHAEAEAAGRLIRLQAGDVLVVNGTEYEVSVNPRGYPHLTKI